ncbi:hypothetical protein APHAL10511_000540 [Amanita phalloides]|nr:hypothetical protein APHAL10511_000540 [Amanita phalloides]
MNATSSRYPQPDVAFEEYLFYAALQRQEEENDILPANPEITVLSEEGVHSTSKTANFPKLPPMTADQVERAHAARAIRLASWLSVFYLLTTDIFGPFNAPYAISQLGWVPGILLFIISSVYFLTDLAGLFTSLSPVGTCLNLFQHLTLEIISWARFTPVSAQIVRRYHGTNLWKGFKACM